MKSLEVLTTEHEIVKPLVDALEAASGQLRAGAPPTALMSDILAALARVVEQVHMAKEDLVVFPYLHDHGLTRSTAVVDALAEQHETIKVYGRRMRTSCERLMGGDASARQELCDAADRFVSLFREHMRIEERSFYGLADQTVEPDDHARLSAQFGEIDRRADAAGARTLAERVLARARSEL